MPLGARVIDGFVNAKMHANVLLKKVLKSEVRSTVSTMRSNGNNTAYAINFKLGDTPVIFTHFTL